MHFNAEERALALFTAYRALVITLIESNVISTDHLEYHLTHGIAALERSGETRVSAAMAEACEPLIADLRRVTQPGGKP
jgi:uncharacterized membrane protein YukC